MVCEVRKNRGSSGCPLGGMELLGLPVTVTASYVEVKCNPTVRWLEVSLSRKFGWCPSIACIKEQRSDVDRSLLELGVQVAKQARAQQGFHGPRLVRHTCWQSWAIQPLTGMRLRESHDLRSGRTSRAAISALRHTDRRPPYPDDCTRWCTP
jgi:hypothetical protein